MNWEVASIIITVILTIAAFLFKVMSWKYQAWNGEDRREVDIKWRENLASKISHLETQQGNLEKLLGEVKKDIKEDIDDLRDSISR